MDTTEALNKALGALITALQAEIGTTATARILDAKRAQIVGAGGITDENLAELQALINSRSADIQGS